MNTLPSNLELRSSAKEKTHICGPFYYEELSYWSLFPFILGQQEAQKYARLVPSDKCAHFLSTSFHGLNFLVLFGIYVRT